MILVNVPATVLGQARMEALQRLVAERGKGLVVIGGDQTFGLGEYADSALEEALPVTVQPPDRDQVATLALVLVIDRSGSMAATDTADRRANRLDLAKEGAILAVETLKPGDQAGVIAFDTSAQWIAELQALNGSGDVRGVADRISRIQLGGGTDFLDGLTLAYRALQQSTARTKHVILMTDGEAPEAGIPQLLAAMRRGGITVSTLGVSADISGSGKAVLERIARTGQGRSYFTNSPNDVPRIMTQEARLAGRSYKEEHDFKPRLMTPAPPVRGLVPSELPDLHGYIRTSPKRAAEIVLASDQNEPILAQWQYGLGRATVWTSEAEGAWGRDWAAPGAVSDAFKRLWPQMVRWTMAAPASPDLRVSVTPDGVNAQVRVESFTPEGTFRNLLQTAADVSLPDGSGQRIPLLQTGPGRYEGRFPLAGAGVYALQVTQTDECRGGRRRRDHGLRPPPPPGVRRHPRQPHPPGAPRRGDRGPRPQPPPGSLAPGHPPRLAAPGRLARSPGPGPDPLRRRRRPAPPAPGSAGRARRDGRPAPLGSPHPPPALAPPPPRPAPPPGRAPALTQSEVRSLRSHRRRSGIARPAGSAGP